MNLCRFFVSFYFLEEEFAMDMYKEENWGIKESNGLCHIWQKENKNI